MVLFINACVREGSRTRILAERLLSGLEGEIEEVRLNDISFPVADEAFLQNRDRLIDSGSFDDPLFSLAGSLPGRIRLWLRLPTGTCPSRLP